MKKLLLSSALAASFIAAPAQAAHVVVEPCDVNLTSPAAEDCAGYYSGNVFNNQTTNTQIQIAALDELGYDFDGDWNSVASTVVLTLQNGNQIDFGQVLYGMTYIGAHFGNVAGPAGNVSVFWAFDFGEEGAQFVTLNDAQGFSNATLYSTGVPPVPEPSTWMMLLMGFAAVGYSLRSRRKKLVPALRSA